MSEIPQQASWNDFGKFMGKMAEDFEKLQADLTALRTAVTEHLECKGCEGGGRISLAIGFGLPHGDVDCDCVKKLRALVEEE